MTDFHPAKIHTLSGTAFFPEAPKVSLPIRETLGEDSRSALASLLVKTRNRLATLLTKIATDNPFFEPTFRFYAMMAEDPALETDLQALISEEKLGVKEAVIRYFDRYSALLNQKGAYFSHRQYDIEDLRKLMLDLWEKPDEVSPFLLPDHAVVVLKKLLSTLLVPLDFSKVVAVVAGEGGRHSHAAIVLDSLGIPLFFLKDAPALLRPGEPIQIDLDARLLFPGNRKGVFLPDRECQEGPVPTVTGDDLQVYPCVSFPEEALRLEPDSLCGIGLVRTETLWLSHRRFPSEEEQLAAYRPLLRHMNGKPVFFRLMDIEPDKISPESAPSGFGAAFLLANPDISKSQLRVFLRLSIEFPLGIIIPMVHEQAEIDGIRDLLDTVRQDFPDSPPRFPIGTMVETVDLSQIISTLHNIDFLTIGSNDLICDLRHSGREDGKYSPQWFGDADFLETIRGIMTQAQGSALPVYVCGEAANDPATVIKLMEMGIHRFCPSPHRIGIYGETPKRPVAISQRTPKENSETMSEKGIISVETDGCQ